MTDPFECKCDLGKHTAVQEASHNHISAESSMVR